MTTIAAAVAHIDKMKADLHLSDESIVALVIENAKLRAQVAELIGIKETKGQRRRITDEFLQRVADVYLNNSDHAPTYAIATSFGVKHRMAGYYVDKARRRGFLPAVTKQRKKARR
jgi:hypothetical protein